MNQLSLMLVYRIGIAFLISTTMSGCVIGGPARWATHAERVVACDMTTEEVEQIAGGELELMSARFSEDATHLIRKSRISITDLRLRFVNNKLKSAEVMWALPLTTRMASYGRTELCGRELPQVGRQHAA